MTLAEILFLAVGVAMDCFAVSICIGTVNSSRNYKLDFRIALHFGIFQAGMAYIGWLLGSNTMELFESIDHWIAAILLTYVGIKLILEGKNAVDECPIVTTGEKTILMLSVATSIDSLAVGVSLGAIPNTNISRDMFIIGITSFLFSMIGSIFAKRIGSKFGSRMEIVGGAILILLAVRVLILHMA